MKRFSMKPMTLGVLTATLLSAGVVTWLATSSDAAHSAAPTPTVPATKAALTVTLTRPRSSSLPMTVSANGSMAAWQEALVGSEVSGLRVQELRAEVGDWVKKGEVLATFASESVQADVAMARASVAEATAAAAEAAANAERARAVQGSGAISAQQISQYLNADAAAQARVASAKAALDAQQLRLQKTRVLAPDSGIITARSASVGAVLGAGQEMFRLIRQGRLEWRAEVTAAEMARLSPGTVVHLQGADGATVQGKVRVVAPTVDERTRNALVYVDVPSGHKNKTAFKPGMYVRGEFELGKTNALTVLQSAVLLRDGFSYVMRVGADKRVAQVKVQTGRRVGDQVELLSGVTANDNLVATGGSFLTEGDTVRVVQEPAR